MRGRRSARKKYGHSAICRNVQNVQECLRIDNRIRVINRQVISFRYKHEQTHSLCSQQCGAMSMRENM
jgi:hypothetical protein